MLLHTDSALKQIVTIPTRKGKTLDVFVTNLGDSYQSPVALPPLQPDDPEHAHPSDHNGLLVLPVLIDKMLSLTKTVTVRRFSDLKINLFGQIINAEGWHFLDPSLERTQLVDFFTITQSNK